MHVPPAENMKGAPVESATVVVINYNGREHLEDCLSSVTAARGPVHEILFVDDASTDSSADFVQERFPEIRIIRLPRNGGPSVARNAGLEHARTRLVALLDNDVVVDRNWLQPMIEAMKNNDRIAVCTSRVMVHEDPEIVDRDGDDAHYVGMPTQRHSKMPLKDIPPSGPVETGAASGISMLVDRSKIPGKDAFDTDFYYGLEDLDFCLAVRIRGYICCFVPDSVVCHKYHTGGAKGLSHSSSVYPERRALYMFRNRWLIMLKYYRVRTLIVMSPALLVFELVSVGFAFRKRLTRKYREAVGSFIRIAPVMKRKRQAIQAARVTPDRELLSGEQLTPGAGTASDGIEARFISGLGRFLRAYWRMARPLL